MINMKVDLSPALAQLRGMGERAENSVREAAFKGAKLVFDEAHRRAPQSKKAHWFYSRRHKDDQAGAKYLFRPAA
uniref:Uncharacterized protein n=1 Tax=Conchiformibius kuhniae TaxID=211502 RepID=A0A8T9MXZ0_9NEIS|nr:hypothetical protein LVJ77_03835 [Conchiformibius kuhniae]